MLTESMLKKVQEQAEAEQRMKEYGWAKNPDKPLTKGAWDRVAEAGRAALADYVLAEAAQAMKTGDRNFHFRANSAWLMGRDHCLEIISRMRGTHG